MQNIIFIIVGFIQLGIAIYGTMQMRKHFNWYALLVLIVVYGLAYDNFVIGLGATIGEGDLLKALNAPRFWVHALFTPAMMIAAFGALRMTGSNFAQSKVWHIIICVLATALIALGSYIDILNLDLFYNPDGVVARYSNGFELMKGPPIPAVLTIIVVVIFGVIMWRNVQWKWLFLGALLMFIAAPMASIPTMQNVGEIAFAAGLVTTQIRAARGK
jgi:hypothetical protein